MTGVASGGALGGPSLGDDDAYLFKYDNAGNLLWSKQFGTADEDRGTGVSVDGIGNIYVSGWTNGSMQGVNAGNYDAFLTKFDPAGNQSWTQQIGTARNDYNLSVAIDSLGNALVSGSTTGDLAATNTGTGFDLHLAKYDSTGNQIWIRQRGTSSEEAAEAVAVDPLGNAYIAGYTQGNLEGPSAGGYDAVLSKYDGAGSELWTVQFGTASLDLARDVAVDSNGNAYVTGRTSGALGGQPRIGAEDVFLAKFDSDGNEQWIKQIGDAAEQGWSVAVDADGNPFVTGFTDGVLGDASAGGNDAILIKFDPDGTPLWTQQLGTADFDNSLSVAIDPSGNAFTSGVTTGDLAGPGANAGGADVYLAKFVVPEPGSLALLGFGGLALMRRRRG